MLVFALTSPHSRFRAVFFLKSQIWFSASLTLEPTPLSSRPVHDLPASQAHLLLSSSVLPPASSIALQKSQSWYVLLARGGTLVADATSTIVVVVILVFSVCVWGGIHPSGQNERHPHAEERRQCVPSAKTSREVGAPCQQASLVSCRVLLVVLEVSPVWYSYLESRIS
jgi:hypothetical protein